MGCLGAVQKTQHLPAAAALHTMAQCRVRCEKSRVFYVVAMRFRVYCTLFIYDCIVACSLKIKANEGEMEREERKKREDKSTGIAVVSTKSSARA